MLLFMADFIFFFSLFLSRLKTSVSKNIRFVRIKAFWKAITISFSVHFEYCIFSFLAANQLLVVYFYMLGQKLVINARMRFFLRYFSEIGSKQVLFVTLWIWVMWTMQYNVKVNTFWFVYDKHSVLFLCWNSEMIKSFFWIGWKLHLLCFWATKCLKATNKELDWSYKMFYLQIVTIVCVTWIT